MTRDLTGRWLMSATSCGEGCRINYAALPLTESLRTELRNGLLAWKAAAEVLNSSWHDVHLLSGPVFWMECLPDCVGEDFPDAVDQSDWVELGLTPMEEMALLTVGEPGAPSREEVMKRLDESMDHATCRTEGARIRITGERTICFTTFEHLCDVEAWSNALPKWVIDWVMSEDEDEELEDKDDG